MFFLLCQGHKNQEEAFTEQKRKEQIKTAGSTECKTQDPSQRKQKHSKLHKGSIERVPVLCEFWEVFFFFPCQDTITSNEDLVTERIQEKTISPVKEGKEKKPNVIK